MGDDNDAKLDIENNDLIEDEKTAPNSGEIGGMKPQAKTTNEGGKAKLWLSSTIIVALVLIAVVIAMNNDSTTSGDSGSPMSSAHVVKALEGASDFEFERKLFGSISSFVCPGGKGKAPRCIDQSPYAQAHESQPDAYKTLRKAVFDYAETFQITRADTRVASMSVTFVVASDKAHAREMDDLFKHEGAQVVKIAKLTPPLSDAFNVYQEGKCTVYCSIVEDAFVGRAHVAVNVVYNNLTVETPDFSTWKKVSLNTKFGKFSIMIPQRRKPDKPVEPVGNPIHYTQVPVLLAGANACLAKFKLDFNLTPAKGSSAATQADINKLAGKDAVLDIRGKGIVQKRATVTVGSGGRFAILVPILGCQDGTGGYQGTLKSVDGKPAQQDQAAV